MKTINILLIEDNTGDIRLINEMLKEIRYFKHNLISVVTLKDAIEQVQKENFDIILLDLNLPDSNGYQTFSSVFKNSRKVPLIILSGLEDVELSFTLIHEGAQEYLFKQDLNAVTLIKAIQYSIERNQIEKNLIEAKERAEELKNVKEEFLANMSHEIRTPMNAIIGYTRLLENTQLTAKQKDWLQAIKLSGENLLVIINDILDLSKIEAGKLELEENQINIPYFLNLIFKTLKVVADEKEIRFRFTVDKKIPAILLGDEVRLNQALQNLISNAIKFTNKGEVKTEVVLENETDENATIRFSVTDTGIGIPDDKIKLIFDSFTQVRDRSIPRSGGTGLGLTITKKIVEMMGGTISATSKYNEGSVFVIELAFKKPKKWEKIQKKQEVKVRKINTESLVNLNILVVEDNHLNAKYILSLFSEYGMKADVAENGINAIEMIKAKKYEIVLMDIEMPKMNGYQTTAVIRNDLKMSIPIIAVTAHAMSGEKEKCLKSGMSDYISKPIKAEYLFEKMISLTNPIKTDKKQNSKVSEEKQNAVEAELSIDSVETESDLTAAKVFDLNLLNASFGGKKNLVLEIINIFLKQAESDISRLNEAIDLLDCPRIRAISHGMRSSFSMMGALKVAPLLEEMEKLGEEANDLDKIKLLKESLNIRCTQVIEALKIEKLNYS
jgi:signal transduction histidine kinase/HPt (histidine-containing phosphotransfer) domain-containing protein